MFVSFATTQRLALMNQRFFGLFLFAVQAQQTFTRRGSGFAQNLNASFGLRDLRHARLRLALQFFHARGKAGGFFAQHRDGLPFGSAAHFPFGGVSV